MTDSAAVYGQSTVSQSVSLLANACVPAPTLLSQLEHISMPHFWQFLARYSPCVPEMNPLDGSVFLDAPWQHGQVHPMA
jgi:hypothetical protein